VGVKAVHFVESNVFAMRSNFNDVALYTSSIATAAELTWRHHASTLVHQSNK
jgi:hypothetical protein